MKKTIHVLTCLLACIAMWACERPKSPDFKVNHQLEAPLSVEKSYPFLGGEGAIVDTTKEDLQNLFSTDNEGLVHLSKEQAFDFNDLNSAIPDVSVPSVEIVNLTVPPGVDSQTVSANGTLSIDNSAFEFRDANHFVGMDGGVVNLGITNGTDISIDLEVRFPEVHDPNGSSLIITINDILPGESISNTVNLVDHRIYAGTDNEIDFEITVSTNSSTAQGGEISTEIGFENLSVNRAEGYIFPKNVLLNEDATGDGELDIFNDDEAEIVEIDGIKDISDKVSDITFANPKLNTLYSTNLGVNTTVYAAIAGVNAKGRTVFLKGKQGSQYNVSSNSGISLEANGNQLNKDQLIKFDLQTSSNGTTVNGDTEFDSTKTNISGFFSNLPNRIRFVGVAKVNDAEQEGTIFTPVNFDPRLSAEVPFNFSASNASFKDTLNADLSDLPGKEDDADLSEARLTVNYTNGLPIDLDLTATLRDENGDPLVTKSDIAVAAATTNAQGFVEQGNTSNVEISFDDDELPELYRTRDIILDIGLNTPQQQAVKIRADDSVTFRIQIKAGLTSTVN